MTVTILIPPAAHPVSLAQIKQHLRIDHIEDDAYLLELADAASLHIEAHIGQKLINRTLRQYVDSVPIEGAIELQAWPVREVLFVTGYDQNGDPSILSNDTYKLQKAADRACLVLSKTTDLTKLHNGMEIDFIAGFGDSGLDVPANIARAVLVLIAHWYEFRGTLPAGDETGLIPDGLERLLQPVRRVRL